MGFSPQLATIYQVVNWLTQEYTLDLILKRIVYKKMSPKSFCIYAHHGTDVKAQ